MGSPPQPQAWEELQNRCLRDFCKIRRQKWRRTPQNFPHFRPFFAEKSGHWKTSNSQRTILKNSSKRRSSIYNLSILKKCRKCQLKAAIFVLFGGQSEFVIYEFEISLFFNDNRLERSVFVWAHTFKAFGYLSKKNYETYWFAFDRSEIRQIFISNGQGNA